MTEDAAIKLLREALWAQADGTWLSGEPGDTDDEISIDGPVDLRALARSILDAFNATPVALELPDGTAFTGHLVGTVQTRDVRKGVAVPPQVTGPRADFPVGVSLMFRKVRIESDDGSATLARVIDEKMIGDSVTLTLEVIDTQDGDAGGGR